MPVSVTEENTTEHEQHTPRKKGSSAIRWLIILALVAGAAVVIFLFGWLPRHKQTEVIDQEAEQRSSALPRLNVTKVKRAPATSELLVPGTTLAYTEAYIYARASGYVTRRFVDIGDHVRKGQLLATIDAPDLDRQVAQARSNLAQSEASLGQVQAQEQLASLTWERWKVLVAKGVFSRQEGDQQEANYRVAVSNVNAARSAIEGNRENLNRLIVLQQYEQVTAPFSGVITARNVDVGTLINSGGSGMGESSASSSPGSLTTAGTQGNNQGSGGTLSSNSAPSTGGSQGGQMFAIASVDRLRVLVSVPEAYSSMIQVRQKADLVFQERSNDILRGQVTRTSASIDQNTRTLLVEVQVKNTGKLVPGMYVTVNFLDVKGSPPLIIPWSSHRRAECTEYGRHGTGPGCAFKTHHYRPRLWGPNGSDEWIERRRCGCSRRDRPGAGRLEDRSAVSERKARTGRRATRKRTDCTRRLWRPEVRRPGTEVIERRRSREAQSEFQKLLKVFEAMKATLLASWLLCPALVFTQTALPSGALTNIQNDKTAPKVERPDYKNSSSFFDFAARYSNPTAPSIPLGTADRARRVTRNGALYLSLYDAIALAIENNLDVEVARYNLSIAGTEQLRASGGGNLRGIDYSVAESPTGVGGPGSPLLNSAASSVTPTTSTVNDLTSLNVLNETSSNLSVQGPTGFAAGPTVPTLQPTIVGQSTFFNRANSNLLTSNSSGVPQPSPGTLNFVTANYALVEGFKYGTQLEVDVNNAAQVLYGTQSRLDPFYAPNTSVTLTQPLLRGRGTEINLRYIRIANINQKVSRLLFYQQLISTVYGISRLYYDLVSLNENVTVKRQSLAAAQKLLEDNRAQVEQGTLAPLELTRAQSLLTSSQLDVIQAEGLVHQQEVILKTQLSRQGDADPSLAGVHVVPTDPIRIPDQDETQPLDNLISGALATRPDLLQASLQVQGGQLALKASQNATRPEVDIIGNFQTRGSTESPYTAIGQPGTGLITTPADLGVAGLRTSRIYQAGIQLNLPLKNHVAEADAARDLLQVRQAQAKTQLLANQVREDVENALIALQTARTALNAAIQSRRYQEQLLDAERDKLTVGASTNLLVIQQQSYLAQARSTEVAARSVWIKARVALDRAAGSLLEKNGIMYADSVRANLPDQPTRSAPAFDPVKR